MAHGALFTVGQLYGAAVGGRRIAYAYIDTTVMDAKFGEGTYTLSSHSNWVVCL